MNRNKAFTLLELIIVIIIVGILATLGLNQYTNIIEKGRQAEARSILGILANNLHTYRLQSGTLIGATYADGGIGTSIPSSCDSSHYFYYVFDLNVDPNPNLWAIRCTASGRPPQGTQYECVMFFNGSSGTRSHGDCKVYW